MYQLPPLPVKKKPRLPYKKPDAVKHLEQLLYEDDCRRHPSTDPRYIARRIMRDDTAGGLTQCIVKYVRLQGAFASRLNNTGVYRGGRYTRSTSRRGLPDILITGRNGRSIFVEVKAGRDRMSQWQKAVRNDQQQAGGLYYLARNFTDFKTWFDGIELIHASIGSTQ